MAWRELLKRGVVIPAHPLALTSSRKIDEKRQRALTRYYLDAGAGGIAVGVHTTQFTIRDHGLLEPVLRIAAEEVGERDVVKVAGICGRTAQAVKEAELACSVGYHAGLLSLAAFANEPVPALIEHARTIASIVPVIGFYLQPAVGGRLLAYEFWREFAAIENVVAIKIAPFNRYQTLDVLRGVAESGRAEEIALYTGNDDNIIIDLLTEFDIAGTKLRFAGGLLGHWAFWTKPAVEMLERVHTETESRRCISSDWLTLNAQTTDANAAVFDASHSFHGCIAGIHEVLRRQGLLEGIWCLDQSEHLSPGQVEDIDRVYRAYPHLNDDQFVRDNLDRWLS